MTTSYPHEQRRSERIPARLQVEVHTKQGERTLTTSDISRHGMFVESDEPLRERHVVQLKIALPAGSFHATAYVSRVVQTDKKRGAGLQLFTMNAEAKEAWDAYFFQLQGEGPKSRPNVVTDAPKDASIFVVKLKNKERLWDFDKSSVQAGGTFLVTPVLRPIGTPVQMILVHPESDEEFILVGHIVRLNQQSPKGVEIAFDALDDERRAEFHSFIDSGHYIDAGMDDAWDTLQAKTPGTLVSTEQVGTDIPLDDGVEPPASDWQDVLGGATPDVADAPPLEPLPDALAQTPLEQLQVVMGQQLADEHTFAWEDVDNEFTINMDIDDDVTVDFEIDDAAVGEMVVGEGKAPPPAPASTLLPMPADALDDDDEAHELDPDVDALSTEDAPSLAAALVGVVDGQTSARVMCAGCDVDASFQIGAADGPLGLVSDLEVFWAEEVAKVVSVPRLRQAPDQRKVVSALGGLDSRALRSPVDAKALLEVASLMGSARHPITRDKLHEPAIIDVLRAALRTTEADSYVDLDGSCPVCGGTWTLVRRG